MPAPRRSRSRISKSRVRRRKSSNAGPWFVAILILAAGGGGGYYYWQQQEAAKAGRARAKKEAERKARAKKTTTTTVPKTIEKDPLEEVRLALDGLLENAQYQEALSRLDKVLAENPGEKVEAAAGKLRDQVEDHAKDRFDADKQKVNGLIATKKYDSALTLLAKMQDYGIGEMGAEARKKVSQVQALQRSTELMGQIEAYTNIKTALDPALSDYDYAAAVKAIDEQAALPQNAAFAEGLLAMKEDFKAVEKLWGQFLKKIEASVGETAMFGIKQGKIKGVREGTFVMDVNGAEEVFTLKDMQPKWIEKRLDLSTGEPDPEKRYALGLLYLHKGRKTEALADLKHVGDGHPGVERLTKWMRWDDEIEAKAKLEELSQAGEENRFLAVRAKIDDLRDAYAGTRMYQLQEEMVRELETQADQAVAEVKGKIDERLQFLDSVNDQKKAEIATWYDTKKAEIQAIYEKALEDPVTYEIIENDAPTVSRMTLKDQDPDEMKAYRYGYMEVKKPTTKEANLETLNQVLKKMKPQTKYEQTRKKQVEEFRKQIILELRKAKSKATSNMTKLKNLREDKFRDLKNQYLRTGRKVRGGDLLTDEQIREALGD